MTTELAAPLNERAELASGQWIEIAGHFLADCKQRLGAMEAPFRYSVVFDDPPPHLRAESTENNALGYTITFAREGIDITPNPDPSAEWFQMADYNCALPLSWIVYEDNPRAAQLEQEYQALLGSDGKDAIAVHQSATMPKSVQAVLAALHDHMARRTINNPDIQHRAEHLGLGSNLRDLEEKGWTVMPGAFSTRYANELRTETARNHAGRNDGASFRATMLLQRGRIWEEAVIHPWVLTLVEWMVGRGALIYQSDTIVKSTGQETHPGLHSDYAASRINEPFPDYCLECTALWAIDDIHREHGPTCFLPDSVRNRAQVLPGTTQEGAQLMELDQGSIAFWHGGLWHGSTPRSAPGQRHSLHNAYCRNYIRPIEDYASIDSAIVRRNPPVFSTLCGLDDVFGKSGVQGADFERMAYAANQGYARSDWP